LIFGFVYDFDFYACCLLKFIFCVLNSVFLFLSVSDGSACFLRRMEKSIKSESIMRNEPNFQKSQMFITVISTMDYNEKVALDTWSKRTQTNPILPAQDGKIAPLFRMSFILMGLVPLLRVSFTLMGPASAILSGVVPKGRRRKLLATAEATIFS